MPAWVRSNVRAAAVAVLAVCVGTAVLAQGPEGRGGARGAGPAPGAPPAPLTPQQLAPQNLSLTGYWVSVVNEDWRWRMVTPPRGDFVEPAAEPRGQRVGNRGRRRRTDRVWPTAWPG